MPAPPRLPGQGLAVRVRDTATAELRPLTPGQTARMYVCGITPYDATHLGHAMTYVSYDLLHRVLLDAGHDVRYVQNVTDVDDPLLERARRTGEEWSALAERETALYRSDMTALGVLPPTSLVGAVESIPTIVGLVQRLLEAGAAYELDHDVYFWVGAAPRFGAVSGLDPAAMLALSAERGGDPERAGKKDPLDPLLWQAERPGEPAWDSPLGRGRPGWHIECAAIALAHLGSTIDLHGGGTDLIFPHHELSAAEAETATGVWPFARTWMHTGMVRLGTEKMSKSAGNLVFVHQLLESHDAAAVRLALLGHHYAESWEWSADDLAAAEDRLTRWTAAVRRPSGPSGEDVLAGVRRHLADDLAAPGALEVVDRWVDEALRVGGRDPESPTLVRGTAESLLGVSLG